MKKRFLSLLLVVFLSAALIPAATATEGTVHSDGVTRAQWITSLVDTFNMIVEEDNYPDNYYSDISSTDAFYRDILVAVEFGIIDLEAGLPFEPNAPATREFAAQTLNLCLGFHLGENTEYIYTDTAAVACQEAAQVAVNRGWFTLQDGAFMPAKAITTAEAETMLNDAETVLAGDVIDADHEDSYEFIDGVVELSEDTVVELRDEKTLILSNPSTPISVGEIFVVYLDGFPVVYRAETRRVSGTLYTHTVTELELSDYLLSVDAQGTLTTDLADFVPAEGLTPIYVLEDGEEVRDARLAGTKKIKSIYFHQPYGDLEINISVTNMVLDWCAQGSALNISGIKASAVVKGHVECFVSVPFGGSLSALPDHKLTLGTVPIGSFGSITIYADVSIDGNVTLDYGADFSAGVVYSYYEGFRMPRSFKKTHFSISVEATVDASITASASVGIPLMDAGVSLTMGSKTNFALRYHGSGKDPSTCIHTDTWIYANASAVASVGIDTPSIFNQKPFKESWSTSLVLWDRNSSPVRSITHFEDGEKVSSCTLGITNFFSGYSTRYYSSTSSRYSNGGISSVVNIPTYTYTTDEEGNATITGYSGNYSTIALPATIDGHTVTTIGKNAFKNRTSLLSVSMPATVNYIDESAFYGCTNLRSVVFSEAIYYIAPNAFRGCKDLVHIDLPDSLRAITSQAFRDCTALVKVEIPDTVTFIGSAAFARCSSLSSVSLSKSLKTIEAYAFFDCDELTSIEIPKSLETTNNAYYSEFTYPYRYAYGPFFGCSNLTDITFEEGTYTIANGLFAECDGVRNITIPDTVTSIGSYSFQNCINLEKVSFSNALKFINQDCFSGCISLIEANIPDTVTYLGPGAFAKCTSLSSVSLSKSLPSIGAYAFFDCDSLTSIEIPKSLEETYDAYYPEFTYPYRYALGPFFGCSNLTDITFEEGTSTIANGLFADCDGIKTITLPDTALYIEADAFYNCTNLETIVFPKNLVGIYPCAFENCYSLLSVDIPDSTKYIAEGSFANCTSLAEVFLPKSLSIFGAHAFHGCTSLVSIEIPKSLESTLSAQIYRFSQQYTFVYGPFSKCTNLTNITFEEGATTIASGLFANCPGIKNIIIPDTVASIGYHAFENCINLETIIIPNSITTIAGGAFKNCDAISTLTLPQNLSALLTDTFNDCDALTSIAIPDSVLSIGGNAFYSCNSLSSVTMPNSVTSIGGSAFYNCDALASITLSDSLVSIGNSAFYDCDALTAIAIPDSVTSVGKYAFYHCELLKDVSLDTGLTKIDEYTFMCCPSLEKIVIPRRVTSIGANAFNSCTKLADITIPRSVTFISASAFSYPDIMTIYGISGTFAETFANDNGFTFVNRPVNATDVILSSSSLTLFKGETATLSLSVAPPDFTDEVNWKSTDTNIVTVTDTGLVSAKGVGAATIKVTVGDVSASCKVTVLQPVTSISLNRSSLSLEALGTYQLAASPYPSTAYDTGIVWSSSDENIATVTQDGLVTGLKKGSATITATAKDGRGASRQCTVTVINTAHIVENVEDLESPHNYTSNCSDFWVFSVPGVEKISLTFDTRTEMEENFDFLYIYDGDGTQVGKYTGTELSGKSIDVPGDTVRIKLVSDNGGNAWGFKVTQISSGVPIITLQPVSVVVKSTDKVTFSVIATGATGYQWQYRTSSVGTWKNATAAGNKTNTLAFNPAGTSRNGYQYRCKVTGSSASVYSDVVTMTIRAVEKPVITASPKRVNTTSTGKAVFSVTATGEGLSYQWQYRKNSSDSWKSATASGSKTNTLTINPAGTTRNGYQYRCKVTNAGGTVYSGYATLVIQTVAKPVITASPKRVNTTSTGKAVFSVTATGEGLNYQWQYRKNASDSWKSASASGSKTATLTINPAASYRNGYQYRCKVSNAGGTVYSGYATLVIQSAAKPVITAQPKNRAVGADDPVTFSVTATGATGYQWQYKVPGSTTWLNNSCTSSRFTIDPAKSYRNGYQYRCKVTGAGGTVYSDAATLTVD